MNEPDEPKIKRKESAWGFWDGLQAIIMVPVMLVWGVLAITWTAPLRTLLLLLTIWLFWPWLSEKLPEMPEWLPHGWVGLAMAGCLGTVSLTGMVAAVWMGEWVDRLPLGLPWLSYSLACAVMFGTASLAYMAVGSLAFFLARLAIGSPGLAGAVSLGVAGLAAVSLICIAQRFPPSGPSTENPRS